MYTCRLTLIGSAVTQIIILYSLSTDYNLEVDLHVHGAGWKLIPEGLQALC